MPEAALKVLVIGATSKSGLAMVRDLGQAGFQVIGADTRLLPFNLHSRYSAPYRRCLASREPGFLQGLIELIRQTRPDVFLPSGTALVGAVSRHRGCFEKLAAINVPPYDSFLTAVDKTRTVEACLSLGIPCPRVLTLEQAERQLDRGKGASVSRTVVVKPRNDRGGARGVSFCRDVATLHRSIEECRADHGEPFLQEYIPGGSDAMRTVLVLFDREARLVAYFTTRKVRQWPVTGGITAMSVSTDDRELLAAVLPFFEKWRWQGPAEVELKVDPRDGRAKVIEINPRICGYIGFPGQCGVGFPRLMALAAAGRVKGPGRFDYAAGVRYINPIAYLKAVRVDLLRSHRKLAVLRQVWCEVRRGAARGSVDRSDPLPRLGKVLREARDVLPGLTHRGRKAAVRAVEA